MSNPNRAMERGSIQSGARSWGWLVFGLCCVGFVLRVVNAHADLGSPHIDENAVVDQAVAFMGGEWRYYLPEYGPLPMYLLAGVYHVAARVHGLSGLEYASRVFFDYEEQYFIGRLFFVACYALLAFVVYRVFAPRFGRWAAALGSLLLALPVLDILTTSKARIDVAQGACQVGALLCLCLALDSGRLRHWLLAGLCAGCAIACKPMPGLLVVPCFLAASWFASEAEAAQARAASGERRGLLQASRAFGSSVLHTAKRPALWGAGLAALLASLACNPTSLNLKEFVAAQLTAMGYYSGSKAPGDHQEVLQIFRALGTPFLAAAVVSLLAVLFFRDVRARLIALFPLVYTLGFWGRPMRAYYLVAPAMSLCLVIAIVLGALLEWLSSSRVAPALARSLLGPLLAASAVSAVAAAPLATLDHTRRMISSGTRAREWILANVPSGTKLYHFGAYGDGPRLVTDSIEEQAKYADYFEYGREHYRFLSDAFHVAYARYVKQGRPRYGIDHTRRRAGPIGHGTAHWLTHRLDAYAIAHGEEYIILCRFGGGSNVLKLHYPWFKSVDLVQQFGHVAIFRVHLPKQNEPASTGDARSRAQVSEEPAPSGDEGDDPARTRG